MSKWMSRNQYQILAKLVCMHFWDDDREARISIQPKTLNNRERIVNLQNVINLAFPIKITKTQAKILLHREPELIWGCLTEDNPNYKQHEFWTTYNTLKEQLEAGFLNDDAFRYKQLLTAILNEMTSSCTALDELRTYQDHRKFGKWSSCASDLNRKFKLVGLNISPITDL